MPRKSLQRKGGSRDSHAFEFTGKEALQAQQAARQRPSHRSNKFSILSAIPDAPNPLLALARKTSVISATKRLSTQNQRPASLNTPAEMPSKATCALKVLSESKFLNKEKVSVRASKPKKVHTRTQKSQESYDLSPEPRSKREINPDNFSTQSSPPQSSDTPNSCRRSGRKRFRSQKAFRAYEESSKTKQALKRRRSNASKAISNRGAGAEDKDLFQDRVIKSTLDEEDKVPEVLKESAESALQDLAKRPANTQTGALKASPAPLNTAHNVTASIDNSVREGLETSSNKAEGEATSLSPNALQTTASSCMLASSEKPQPQLSVNEEEPNRHDELAANGGDIEMEELVTESKLVCTAEEEISAQGVIASEPCILVLPEIPTATGAYQDEPQNSDSGSKDEPESIEAPLTCKDQAADPAILSKSDSSTPDDTEGNIERRESNSKDTQMTDKEASIYCESKEEEIQEKEGESKSRDNAHVSEKETRVEEISNGSQSSTPMANSHPGISSSKVDSENAMKSNICQERSALAGIVEEGADSMLKSTPSDNGNSSSANNSASAANFAEEESDDGGTGSVKESGTVFAPDLSESENFNDALVKARQKEISPVEADLDSQDKVACTESIKTHSDSASRCGREVAKTSDVEARPSIAKLSNKADDLFLKSTMVPTVAYDGKDTKAMSISNDGTPSMKSTLSKRVRFVEPEKSLLPSENGFGFSKIMKMRKRRDRRRHATSHDGNDVTVIASSSSELNEKDQRVLLDELQYLLDGIFKPNGNSERKSPELETRLISKSLVALTSLILRRPRKQRSSEGDENESALVQILLKQPSLFKTIVGKLCSVLGKSRSTDAMLALVLVLIFRATRKLLLINPLELDSLLNSFFRSSAAGLKSEEIQPTKDVLKRKSEFGTKKALAKRRGEAGVNRRKGRLAKRLAEETEEDSILTVLNKFVLDADIIDDKFDGFKSEPVAAAHLIGIAVSLIMSFHPTARIWMRENRRLDKVVAVLYSCEKLLSKESKCASDVQEMHFDENKIMVPWIVLGSSLNILEYAVLDNVCQARTARESRVCSIVVDIIKSVDRIRAGTFSTEWILSAALRVSINLTHGFPEATDQFVEKRGHELTLSLLTKECKSAGLITKGAQDLRTENFERSFDVRILCFAFLSSLIDQKEEVCNQFHVLNVQGLEKRKAGGLEIITEILQATEGQLKSYNDEIALEKSAARGKVMDRNSEKLHSEKSEIVMEKKITLGYTCLLVGALVQNNTENRKMIEGLIPSHTLLGVAAVLAEFLEFHHEVGVISASLDRMYGRIIDSLVKPFQIEGSGEGASQSGNTDAVCGKIGSGQGMVLEDKIDGNRGEIDEKVPVDNSADDNT